mmetsp:Transcript_78797/g.189084  ORF Transcript_78797/g.189084 Transcript_78797/m.189084 type:complete len:205 (-) Transcript_78797:424-1038(-)
MVAFVHNHHLAGVGVSTAFIKTHFEDAAPWHAIDHLGRLPPSGSEPISSQGRCGRVHVIPVSSLPETGDEGLAGFPTIESPFHFAGFAHRLDAQLLDGLLQAPLLSRRSLEQRLGPGQVPPGVPRAPPISAAGERRSRWRQVAAVVPPTAGPLPQGRVKVVYNRVLRKYRELRTWVEKKVVHDPDHAQGFPRPRVVVAEQPLHR